MSKTHCDLSRFKAIVFDVDGVLSHATVPLGSNGEPQRTVNVRDGYAIKTAIDKGICIAIISGGMSSAIEHRYRLLGMTHIYMGIKHKQEALHDLERQCGFSSQEMIYVGDDLPDLAVMKLCGFAVAPHDAAPEVCAVADYISPICGGNGVARDIIEELLKAKGLWMNEEAFGW